MARKKKGNTPDRMSEQFDKMVEMYEDLSPGEAEMFEHLLEFAAHVDGFNALLEHANSMYTYPRPDYSALVGARCEVMERLHNAFIAENADGEQSDEYTQDPDDKYPLAQFLADCEAIAPEHIEKEISNAIYGVLSAYYDNDHDEADNLPLRLELAYLLAAVEHFNAVGCLPAVLELERQDAFFINRFLGSMTEPVSTLVLHLNPKSLTPLLDLLCDVRTTTLGRSWLGKAMGHLLLAHPERRLEVVAWVTRALDILESEGERNGAINPFLLSEVCNAMVIAKLRELLPRLNQIFADLDGFYTPALGNEKKIVKLIKSKKAPDLEGLTLELEFSDMTDFVSFVLAGAALERGTYHGDGESYDWEDEDWEDDQESDEDFDPQFNPFSFGTSPKVVYDDNVEPCKLTLDIALRGIDPIIWRRVEVPSSIRLDSLAMVVLRAMGWEGGHMFAVIKGRTWYELTPEDDSEPITKYCAADLLKTRRSSVRLLYDFGDSWDHNIAVAKVEKYAPDEAREVRLVDGTRACPPEDCGGSWGYREMLDILADPDLDDDMGYREMFEDFDPEAFSLAEAAARVSLLN